MHPPDPLRVCTLCTPPHYENCRDCFGFGWRESKSIERLPVSAVEALERAVTGVPMRGERPCGTCGSTWTGLPAPRDVTLA